MKMRVIFIDETIFSFSTYQAKAWYHRNVNIEASEKLYNMKTLALIAGVSTDRGVDHFAVHPRSITRREFILFLEDLALQNKGHRVALFMDNLRVHWSKDA